MDRSRAEKPGGPLTLYGNKVVLRHFSAGFSEQELAQVYRWSQDQEVLRWSGGSPTDLGFEEFKREFRKYSRNRDHRIGFTIFTHQGRLIGRLGCFGIDWEAGEGELGIVIGDKSYWGHGYGPDAIHAFLAYLFEKVGLERVYLFTYPDNVRARRAFKKCGFERVGHRRHFTLNWGARDEIEMAVTRDQFNDVRLIQHDAHQAERFQ